MLDDGRQHDDKDALFHINGAVKTDLRLCFARRKVMSHVHASYIVDIMAFFMACYPNNSDMLLNYGSSLASFARFSVHPSALNAPQERQSLRPEQATSN